MSRYIPPVIILAVAFAIMLFISSLKKEQKRHPPGKSVRAVSASVVKLGANRPVIRSMGRVRSLDIVDLIPEVSGLVQEKGFNLRKGGNFKKGQVLAQIDPRVADNNFKTAISDLQSALALLLPELKSDFPQPYERWRTFFDSLGFEGGLPGLPREVEGRVTLYLSRYNIYKLYFLARNQAITLERHTLRAPFGGTVRSSNINPASMARAGSPLASLSRSDVIEVEAPLPYGDAGLLRPGLAVKVRAGASKTGHEGRISRIGSSVDERMQTVPVFITVQGAESDLMDGEFAEVVFSGDLLPGSFTLPRKAIHQGDRIYQLANGALQEKTVQIAYLSMDSAYITGGVSDGDTLVAEPLQDAVIGMAVTAVINVDMSGK